MTVLEELIHSVIGWDYTGSDAISVNKIWTYITDHINTECLPHIPAEFCIKPKSRKISFYFMPTNIVYFVEMTYKEGINKTTLKFSYEDESEGIVPLLSYTLCDHRKTNAKAIKIVEYIDKLAVLNNFFIDISYNDFINFLRSDEIIIK